MQAKRTLGVKSDFTFWAMMLVINEQSRSWGFCGFLFLIHLAISFVSLETLSGRVRLGANTLKKRLFKVQLGKSHLMSVRDRATSISNSLLGKTFCGGHTDR